MYKGKFDLDKKNDIATFSETFNYKNKPKIRKQKHKLHMPEISVILEKARNNNLKLVHKIGMIPASYEYNYLYIFKKI